MKKLTIEQKAKAYDEALKVLHKYDGANIMFTQDLKEEMFPELKESEDERIRKWLIYYFKEVCDNVSEKEKKGVLTWLEKQGEKIDVIENFDTEFERQISHLIASAINKEHEYNQGYVKWVANGLLEYAKHELEKQGEHKHTDKVKSKFHEGEWITNGNYTWKIIEVKPLDYILQSQDGNIVDDTISHIDKQFHSFTIEDAKAGDVLVCKKNEKPFIFKGFLDKFHPENPVAYCGIGTDGVLIVNTGDGWWTNDKVQPATKEQCDLLFQWIKEAGYEWDAEKKGLKRIEQKPAEWHREDEQNLNACLGYIPDEFLRRWLQDIIHAKYDKTIWSKEDEKYSSYICAALDCYYRLRKDRSNTNGQEDLDKARNWLYNKLKSIRPSSQWKPSDMELEVLKLAAEKDGTCLMGLYEQLKKLREE